MARMETMLWWFGHATHAEIAAECDTGKTTIREDIELCKAQLARERRPLPWTEEPARGNRPIVLRAGLDLRPRFLELPASSGDSMPWPDPVAFLTGLANRQGLLVPPMRLLHERTATNERPRPQPMREGLVDAPEELLRQPLEAPALRLLVQAMALTILPASIPRAPQREIDIRYHRPGTDPMWRRVRAHALSHDSFRWAIRAREQGEPEYRDYVLDRILDARIPKDGATGDFATPDTDWMLKVPVTLCPDPRLSELKAQRIAEQHEMPPVVLDGRRWWARTYDVRRCLVVYFLKRLQLEEERTDRKPDQRPVIVWNRAEVTEAIPEGMRIRPAA
jgi:hypothetical protein